MAFGAKFINDSGTIQVDDTMQNYELKTTGSVAISPYGSTATVTLACSTKAILALKPSAGLGVVQRSVSYNSTTGIKTWRFWSNGTGTLNYYIFDAPDQTTPMTGFGLVLRNAANEITFHSAKKYLRVAGMHSILANTGSFSQQYDTSKSYAVVVTGDGLYTNNKRTITDKGDTYDVWDLYLFLLSISSTNVISCGPKVLIDNSTEKGPYKFASLYALIIDVTNY